MQLQLKLFQLTSSGFQDAEIKNKNSFVLHVDSKYNESGKQDYASQPNNKHFLNPLKQSSWEPHQLSGRACKNYKGHSANLFSKTWDESIMHFCLCVFLGKFCNDVGFCCVFCWHEKGNGGEIGGEVWNEDVDILALTGARSAPAAPCRHTHRKVPQRRKWPISIS